IETQIVSEKIIRGDIHYLEALAGNLSPKAGSRITIIDTGGKVLADSEKTEESVLRMENHSNRPEIRTAMAGDAGIDIRYSPTLKIDMLYAALPIRDNDRIVGVLRLALPLVSVQKTLLTIREIVFIGLFFALCFAFILGSILAARATGPINNMIEVSRKFSEGDFTKRIFRVSRDEIGELAATLNSMAEEIESKVGEIKAQNQKLAAIFDGMIEGIIVTDGSGHIVSVNPAVENIFGVSAGGVRGKLFLEAIRNNDVDEAMNRALKSGEPIRGEVTLLYPVRKIFEISATPTFGGGEVSGCVTVIHDITEMRRLETIRKDFVANVSHELKTPLTSIKGFVETLLEGALDDKVNSRNFLKIVQDHTGRLDALVNDLLSLSSLESKEIRLEKSDISLREHVEEIILGFKAQLNRKNVSIENGLPHGLKIRADRNRIEQVFTNLIDNAIKFNKEKGCIKIYCREADGKVEIIVEDSGIGIPEKDIPRIFERFYRVDKARSRELGGTGLGLSIVKHIIELHGGLVSVESAEGFGSKLRLTLPRS
ncbi:MAG: ATP-binding protein, partial [Candidatus Omnitrophica bacterium]|nr:ATP-binding protein [Candidatus Omnitrophota bacterium]